MHTKCYGRLLAAVGSYSYYNVWWMEFAHVRLACVAVAQSYPVLGSVINDVIISFHDKTEGPEGH